MPFAFGGVNISDVTIKDFTLGLQTERDDLVDRLCTVVDNVTGLYGVLPRLLEGMHLVRLDDLALEPGEVSRYHDGGAGDTTYRCTADEGRVLIYDEDIAQLDAAAGYNLVEDRIAFCHVMSETKRLKKVVDALSDTALNTEYDVTTDGSGGWADTVNGKPLADLIEIRDNFAPDADALYYTIEARRYLLKHPDIIAETVNFNAGQLTPSTLPALLAAKLDIPVENVIEIRRKVNTAARGLTPSVGYMASNLAWFGHKSNLILVDPKNPPGKEINHVSIVKPAEDARGHKAAHIQYSDVLIPDSSKSCTITNIDNVA